MNRPSVSCLLFSVFCSLLSACSPADPALVARAVNATLTAAISPTPIVVVVTVEKPVTVIPPDTATPTLTETPMPTATATTTPTPTDTPTLAASPTLPFAVGDSIWHDDFTDPGLWYPTDDVAQRTEVRDGQLFITLKLAERFALTYNNTRRAQDFYAAVTGRAAVCATRDRYGLLFRVQDGSNYYLLDVDCDGRYRVTKMVNDERTILQDWAASADLRSAGQPNTLGVRAQGHTFEVFINQKSQAVFTDEGFADGGFGLYAGSGAISLNFTASFDDLQVWKLK
jgi:hypothetical protein